MNPHDLFGSDYNAFCERDPFNPQNEVEGFISRKPNEYYGALIITKINGKDVPEQLIMGSPKIHYPFDSLQDGTRRYKFPVVRDIEIYEKLDGTNVLAYSYTDDLNLFYSFKTRLRPFLGSSKFGDFQSMWNEVGMPYLDNIKRVIRSNNCNLSFEVYGARNPHLLMYKNPLDIALLFGVTNTGTILSPTALGLAHRETYVPLDKLPLVARFKVIDKDYVWNYESIQKELEAKLQKEEEGYYSGVEGTVWYLITIDGQCIQFKCKPETIEAIHFSAGAGGLSKNVIVATCWNAFENMESPTVEFVKTLLIEEFAPEIVEAKHYLVEKSLAFVLSEMEFRLKILDEYRKLDMNILLNKKEVMRSLSDKFAKNQMKKVYSLIVAYS